MGVKMRERKPGEWWLFIDHKGKRKAKKIGSKEAAESAASELEEALGKKDLRLRTRAEIVTFRQYAEKWIKGHVAVNLKPATLAHYQAVLDKFIYPDFGGSPIDEIRRDEIKALCFRVLEKGYSKSSALHVARAMSAIFSHAIEDELLLTNPASRPGRFVKGARPGEKADFLTPDEGNTLLEAAREHYGSFYPLLLAALRTGMRKGELRGLQWGDLDFHGRFIEVRRGFSKGDLSTPKSGKPRRVDMSDQLATVLEDHRRTLAAAVLKAGVPFPEWVFPSRAWGPRDESNLDGCFRRCLTKAGLRHIRFHDLRHSVASWYLARGHSPVYVKEQLGHSTIKLTVDTYGHFLPSDNREAANSLDDPKWKETRNPSATRSQFTKMQGAK